MFDTKLWIVMGPPALTAILALLILLLLFRKISRKNHTQPDQPGLWEGREYTCPQCKTEMEQGWVLLGKGAIWSPRSRGKPGIFSSITATLPNTLSLSFRPAVNMAWHCSDCQILMIDHHQLIR